MAPRRLKGWDMGLEELTCRVDECEQPIHARGFCALHYGRNKRLGYPGELTTKRPRELLDRLANKFFVGDGCWEWTGAKSSGYGNFPYNGEVKAYRVVYELLVGPIPDGMELDHLAAIPVACALITWNQSLIKRT